MPATALTFSGAILANYSPEQARDEGGRWTSGAELESMLAEPVASGKGPAWFGHRRELLEGRPEIKTGQPYETMAYRGLSASTPVDEGMHGKGTYFTQERSYAGQYADKGQVVGTKIRLENPYVVTQDNRRGWNDLQISGPATRPGMSERERGEATSQHIRNTLEQLGHDGIVIRSAPHIADEIVVFHPDKSAPDYVRQTGRANMKPPTLEAGIIANYDPEQPRANGDLPGHPFRGNQYGHDTMSQGDLLHEINYHSHLADQPIVSPMMPTGSMTQAMKDSEYARINEHRTRAMSAIQAHVSRFGKLPKSLLGNNRSAKYFASLVPGSGAKLSNASLEAAIMANVGDLPGHPFRGNQHTGGTGGEVTEAEHRKIQNLVTDRVAGTSKWGMRPSFDAGTKTWSLGPGWNTSDTDHFQAKLGPGFIVNNTNGYINIQHTGDANQLATARSVAANDSTRATESEKDPVKQEQLHRTAAKLHLEARDAHADAKQNLPWNASAHDMHENGIHNDEAVRHEQAMEFHQQQADRLQRISSKPVATLDASVSKERMRAQERARQPREGSSVRIKPAYGGGNGVISRVHETGSGSKYYYVKTKGETKIFHESDIEHIPNSEMKPTDHNLAILNAAGDAAAPAAVGGLTTPEGNAADRLSEGQFKRKVPGKHDGEKLTGRAIHLGALAHKDFKAGKNPAGWAVDEDVWDKAKTAASKSYDMEDDAFWPVVATIYEKMGGTVGGKANADLLALGIVANYDPDQPRAADGKFSGSAYEAASSKADRKSSMADEVSKSAQGSQAESDHHTAAFMHRDAAQAHHLAWEAKPGDQMTAATHQAAIDYHRRMAALHEHAEQNRDAWKDYSKLSADAQEKSDAANQASYKAGNTGWKRDHADASQAHSEAAEAHFEAAKHSPHGAVGEEHEVKGNGHVREAARHEAISGVHDKANASFDEAIISNAGDLPGHEFHGNQFTENGLAVSQRADKETADAAAASKAVAGTYSMAGHKLARDAHLQAALTHNRAASMATDDEVKRYHRAAAQEHLDSATDHSMHKVPEQFTGDNAVGQAGPNPLSTDPAYRNAIQKSETADRAERNAGRTGTYNNYKEARLAHEGAAKAHYSAAATSLAYAKPFGQREWHRNQAAYHTERAQMMKFHQIGHMEDKANVLDLAVMANVGDTPGHPFRGNQHTAEAESQAREAKDLAAKAAERTKDAAVNPAKHLSDSSHFAMSASRNAHSASEAAERADTPLAHEHAAQAHAYASAAHRDAMAGRSPKGYDATVHKSWAEHHTALGQAHMDHAGDLRTS